MTRQSTKRPAKPARDLLPGWWAGLSPSGRRQLVMIVVHLTLIGAMAAGVYFGLRYAEDYTHSLDRYRQGTVKVVLRVKCHGGEPMMTVRAVESAGLAKDARVTYVKTEASTGLVVVESKDQQIRLSGDDVLPEWLMQFQYVRDNLLRRADAPANHPADSTAAPGPGESDDWFTGLMPARIAAALAEDPFVDRVIQVDKQLVEGEGSPGAFQRQVVVTVALRKPLAQIFINRPGQMKGYVVDAKGVILEERQELIRFGTGMASAVLPQVTEFAMNPNWRVVAKYRNGKLEQFDPLMPGVNLNSADVQAGLDLLGKLSGQPFYRDIAEVNVGNFEKRRSSDEAELALQTVPVQRSPTETLPPDTILWGLRQDNVRIDRNDTRGKIAILNGIWAQDGRLDLRDPKRPPYDLFHVEGHAYWIDPAAHSEPATGGAASPRSGPGPWAGRM